MNLSWWDRGRWRAGGRVMNPLSKAIQALRSIGAAAASSALCTAGVTDISDSTDN